MMKAKEFQCIRGKQVAALQTCFAALDVGPDWPSLTSIYEDDTARRSWRAGAGEHQRLHELEARVDAFERLLRALADAARPDEGT